MRELRAPSARQAAVATNNRSDATATAAAAAPVVSELRHWPVQLMLVPPHAPFLRGADLVVCADCVPFTVPDFHARYLHDRAVVVGCPKLDDLAYYAEKLEMMLHQAKPRRLTVVRMEVPCCSGLAQAAVQAALADDTDFPIEEHVVSLRGEITCTKVRAGAGTQDQPSLMPCA